MFLTKEDLQSHLRNELQDLITRGDDTIIAAAIDGATGAQALKRKVISAGSTRSGSSGRKGPNATICC